MPISDSSSLLAAVSSLPGIYRFVDEKGKTLYVGKAQNLKKRLSSYFQRQNRSPRTRLMLEHAVGFDTTITASEAEALLLENDLIKAQSPRYNILFRDDKSYPFLRMSNHPYPRLTFYRGSVKKDAHYFGPFPDVRSVKTSIDILQQIFRLRTCSDSVLSTRDRPCLLHSIGRCSAPCVNDITPEQYRADVNRTIRFLTEGDSAIKQEMSAEMELAAEKMEYERAAVLRDRLHALSVVQSSHGEMVDEPSNIDYVGLSDDGGQIVVNIVFFRGGRSIGEKRLFPQNLKNADIYDVAGALFVQHYTTAPTAKIALSHLPTNWKQLAPHLQDCIIEKPKGVMIKRLSEAVENAKQAGKMQDAKEHIRKQRLQLLSQHLHLKTVPKRLECFDVSHSMGEETIASRVVFDEGAPKRQDYRLFRIKDHILGDDLSAMKEAVFRCYRRVMNENASLPDILFIDGGRGQLTVTLEAFASLSLSPPKIYAIAKGAARCPGKETLIADDGEILNLPPTDGAMHLIQSLRDEAHRFALQAHRRRRDKKRKTFSILEGIEGVGLKKQRQLINYFGGLQALRAAGVQDFLKIQGIGVNLASRIYRVLHR